MGHLFLSQVFPAWLPQPAPGRPALRFETPPGTPWPRPPLILRVLTNHILVAPARLSHFSVEARRTLPVPNGFCRRCSPMVLACTPSPFSPLGSCISKCPVASFGHRTDGDGAVVRKTGSDACPSPTPPAPPLQRPPCDGHRRLGLITSFVNQFLVGGAHRLFHPVCKRDAL